MGSSRQYTLYFSARAWGWTELELFAELAEYLNKTGRPTKLCRARHFGLRWRRFQVPWPIGESCAVLLNERTGQFGVMVCEDKVRGSYLALRAIASDPRCRVILKQQYRGEYYKAPWASKVRPWTYLASHPKRLQALLPRLRRANRTQAGLFFRGNFGVGGRQGILQRLAHNGRLAVASTAADTSFEQYCAELSTHQLALALPGHGALCHREIEAFGIGTPVLMPRQPNELHDALIPEHHYLSADVDVTTASARRIAEAIEARYLEVHRSGELLQRIANNAKQWYDANAAFPSALQLTASLLGLLHSFPADKEGSRIASLRARDDAVAAFETPPSNS